MLLLRKPVITFATHSLAGFFLYILFYLNFRTYVQRRKRLFLLFSICYLVFTVAQFSVTGLLLGIVGVIQILYHFWSKIPKKLLWSSTLLSAVMVFVAFGFLGGVGEIVSEGADAASAILTSPGNGLLGRLGPGAGLMYDAIEYIKEHPFSPVGAGVRNGIVFADMGVIDYLMRGSVVLLFFAYGGLFFFLRRSLRSRADFYLIFGAIVVFEVGFSTLTYFRMLFLLPFFTVYLNSLQKISDAEC